MKFGAVYTDEFIFTIVNCKYQLHILNAKCVLLKNKVVAFKSDDLVFCLTVNFIGN